MYHQICHNIFTIHFCVLYIFLLVYFCNGNKCVCLSVCFWNANVTVRPFMSYQSDTPANDNNAGNCKACAYALRVRKREREKLHTHRGQTTVPAESRTVTKECDRCNGDALGIKKPSVSCCLLAPPGLRADFSLFFLLDVIY